MRRRSRGSRTARPARRRTGSPPAPRQRRRCSPRARTTAASARSRPCTARRRGPTGRRRPAFGLDPAPWVGNVRPFVVPSVEMLRTRPPHALTSRAYAREFNEIKDVGSLHSTTRTPDQTSAAIFWQDHAFALWNRTFRTLAASRHLDIVDSARLFATENLAAADAAIGCWNNKYHWNTWRPITAIREAASDGNRGHRRRPGLVAAVRSVDAGRRAARARHPAVPGVPLRPQLRRRRDPGLAPVLLPHRPRRVQRVQQQERDDAQLDAASPRPCGRTSTRASGPGSTSGRPTSPAPRSARRSRATSTTTTSNPASDAAPRPRAEATAPTAAPPPRNWCGRGGGVVTGPRARRACARSARGGARRTAGTGTCSACGSSPRARHTSEPGGSRRSPRLRTTRADQALDGADPTPTDIASEALPRGRPTASWIAWVPSPVRPASGPADTSPR